VLILWCFSGYTRYTSETRARHHKSHSLANIILSSQSTEEDATYVKGWWRKAQALVALNRHKEAKTAFLEAQKIEPKNSQLKKELAKVESKIEQQALLADSDDAPPAITEPVMTTTKSYSGSKTTTKTTSTTTKGTTARASKPVDEKVVDGDAGDDDDGEKIRGYKLNKDGKKTSFFNKDLSEEDKKLIGDITPKAIAKAEDAATPAALKKEKGVSAWNTAGTWEEKNLDNWGNDGMKKLLRESSFTIPPQIAPDAVIKVDKVKDFDGSVSVVKVRGKTRCNYEFSFTLEWSVTLPSGPCKGTLQFPDVAPDCDGEFETQFIVDKTTPPDAKGVLNTFVKSDSEGLKREIVNNINKWVKDYRAEYLS